jgi:hypothetical protein
MSKAIQGSINNNNRNPINDTKISINLFIMKVTRHRFIAYKVVITQLSHTTIGNID